MSEEYLNGLPAIESLSDVERDSLPTWIKSNLATVRIIGNASRTIELQDGRRYSLDNAINDLAGADWTKYICSVVNTHYSTKGEDSYAHELRKIHPTPKPPQLMKNIIEFFTKEGEIVFDYFMGGRWFSIRRKSM